MKTYIFGAGTSRHAGYPLGASVWIDTAAWIKERNSHSDYRNLCEIVELRFGGYMTDFEQMLTKLESEAKLCSREEKASLTGLRREMQDAVCDYFDYLRHGEASAYKQFSKTQIHPSDRIITFNYDVSLERELKRAGKWEVGNGYGIEICSAVTGNSSVKLLKLHGSTNWFAQLFDGVQGSRQMGNNSLGYRPVLPPNEMAYLGYQGLRDPLFNGGGLIRGMIMPGLEKQFFFSTPLGQEWKEFWDGLWRLAKEALECSAELFIVGFALSPNDTRARQLMHSVEKKNLPITVCSNVHSDHIARELREMGFQNVHVSAFSTFEEWVKS